MSTTLNLEEITRLANEAHQRRLDTLRELVTHHDAVTTAEQQLQAARDDADAAIAIATDAGWSNSELADFGLTSTPVPKRTSRGRGKQRTKRTRTTSPTAPAAADDVAPAQQPDTVDGARTVDEQAAFTGVR